MRVVAEYGQTNRGSVATAIAQAKAAAAAGCWGAKWQLLRPETLASPAAEAYWAHARPGESQRDTFDSNGMIDYGAWKEVREECDRLGLVFVATPFDLEAVDELADIGTGYLKVASGDITYHDLLARIRETDAKVILSTGASYLREVDQALEWLDPRPTTILACALVYPCPPEEARLGRIELLRAEYDDVGIGYSDHTVAVSTGAMAAIVGAEILEKHATLDRAGGTPDDEMGLTPGDLDVYVRAAEEGERMRGKGFGPSDAEEPARVGARRSWHAAVPLAVGDVIMPWDLAALRPCPEDAVPVSVDITGYRVTSDILPGSPVRPSEIAPDTAPSPSKGLGGSPRG